FFTGAVLFQIITLPVEFDASKRALAQLTASGSLAPQEVAGAKAVLDAAALTYVAAAAMAGPPPARPINLRDRRSGAGGADRGGRGRGGPEAGRGGRITSRPFVLSRTRSRWRVRARQPCATMSFNSLDTLNTGTLRGGTGTASPVRGFRAIRDLRSLTRNVP